MYYSLCLGFASEVKQKQITYEMIFPSNLLTYWSEAVKQGYAERTAFLHRKNAGQLYFSNTNSVNFSRLALTFHWHSAQHNEQSGLVKDRKCVNEILVLNNLNINKVTETSFLQLILLTKTVTFKGHAVQKVLSAHANTQTLIAAWTTKLVSNKHLFYHVQPALPVLPLPIFSKEPCF